MSNETLETTLKALRVKLAILEKTDPQVRQLLSKLDADIRNVLSSDESQASGLDLAEQSRDLSARFAARHPQIEPILRDLANLLSSMGI